MRLVIRYLPIRTSALDSSYSGPYILILILMLKLELPQVMLPWSEAPSTDVRAFFLPVPAHEDL